MRNLGRIVLRVAVALAVVLAVCSIAGVLILRSGWFQERVRTRIIAEIQRVTGHPVELGDFSFDWGRMQATAGPLVIHGLEPSDEPALLRAQSVTLGLKIISVLERKVDLASLHVEQPVMRIVVYPDGSTNLPRLHPQIPWTQDVLDVAVRRFDVVDGLLEYDERRVPLNLRGESLKLQMDYDPRGPRYRGQFSSRKVRVMALGASGPWDADASGAFTLEHSRIDFSRVRLATRESRFDLAGAIEDLLQPHGTFTVRGNIAVREAVALFHLPVPPAGSAAFDGRISFTSAKGFDYQVAGRVNAKGVGYAYDRLKIEGAEVRADVNLVPDKLTLRALTATMLGSTLTGQADLEKWTNLHFKGSFDGLTVHQAAAVAIDRALPWDGVLSGDLLVDAVLGEASTKLQVNVGITRPAQGRLIEGQLNISYDQAAGSVNLGNSYLATPATRLNVAGTLGQALQVNLQSTDLNDLLPALAMAGNNAPKELPVKLTNGRATFNGTVSGPLDDPRVTGQASLTNAGFNAHAFDRFTSDIEASRRQVKLTRLVLARGPTQMEGSAEITPKDGKFDDAAMAAQLTVRNAQIAELANEAGVATAITGTAGGTVRIYGSLLRPEAELAVQVEKPVAFGEQVDRLRGLLRYSPSLIDVTAGEADMGSAKFHFQGAYQHPEDDWKNGAVRFEFAVQNLPISRAETLSKLQPGLDATLDGKANGTARIVKSEFAVTTLNGELSARDISLEHQPLGDLSLTAETKGSNLSVHAHAKVRDATMQGQGSWRLEGDHPGSATIRFSRISMDTLHSLIMIPGTREQKEAIVPFEGFIEGGAAVSVALLKPRDFTAELTIEKLHINPKPTQILRLGVQQQDLVVQNAKDQNEKDQPIVVALSSKEARIRSARLTARDTNLEVTGAVPFDSKQGADLTIHGSVNLIVLQLLNPDLAARGNATVQATIRGSLKDPQVVGRMELKDASLYLSDLPNGVDSANGVLVFDRNRATIERLTAQTGGGTVTFAGFIGFGSTLIYRLQAEAQNVRVRYPEDVSVTFTATLALNGTSDSSTVSGMVTLNRASFTPRADVAQILAQTTKSMPTSATPSEYLRGMQFDIRIESGPNFQLQTSLTRNVEAEVDLRLRGTPLRPVLLGTASVNAGEIQVFGNRYTVNRGDIRFLNPVKIDPIFDMDLETKARSVTVNIALSGSLQKLNVNYSSDPPMQPREIIALLAVGRAPTDSAGLSSTQPSTTSSSLAEAGGSLLGQAVSAQLSSRLQRFFGASRVKIDPALTGADYLPQARLTIEQQVSKDITLTYITNLNRTQEQIVQVEWDFSRQWSAVAVREANGLFGIDFQFKKRFK